MTTQVKVQPAGHRVQVTKVHGGGRAEEKEVLEPNTAERTFHIHSTMSLILEEVEATADEDDDGDPDAEDGTTGANE